MLLHLLAETHALEAAGLLLLHPVGILHHLGGVHVSITVTIIVSSSSNQIGEPFQFHHSVNCKTFTKVDKDRYQEEGTGLIIFLIIITLSSYHHDN